LSLLSIASDPVPTLSANVVFVPPGANFRIALLPESAKNKLPARSKTIVGLACAENEHETRQKIV
jgi:hypothetical protein